MKESLTCRLNCLACIIIHKMCATNRLIPSTELGEKDAYFPEQWLTVPNSCGHTEEVNA